MFFQLFQNWKRLKTCFFNFVWIEKQLQNDFFELNMKNSPKTCFFQIFQIEKDSKKCFFQIAFKLKNSSKTTFLYYIWKAAQKKYFFNFLKLKSTQKRDFLNCISIQKQIQNDFFELNVQNNPKTFFFFLPFFWNWKRLKNMFFATFSRIFWSKKKCHCKKSIGIE